MLYIRCPWHLRCCKLPPSEANGCYVNVVLTGVKWEFELWRIVAVYKRWANSGLACIYKEKYSPIYEATRKIRSLLLWKFSAYPWHRPVGLGRVFLLQFHTCLTGGQHLDVKLLCTALLRTICLCTDLLRTILLCTNLSCTIFLVHKFILHNSFCA